MMSAGPEPTTIHSAVNRGTARRSSTTLGSRTSSSATVMTSSSSLSSATSTSSACLHTAHRQSHNQSKLPAFRFTDLNTVKSPVGLVLPSCALLQQQHQQHLPPSPALSPNDPSSQGPQDQSSPNPTNQDMESAQGPLKGPCVGSGTTGTAGASPLSLQQGKGQGQGPAFDNIAPSASDPLHLPQNIRSHTATHPPTSGFQQGQQSALRHDNLASAPNNTPRSTSAIASSRPPSMIRPPRARASTLQQQSKSVAGVASSPSASTAAAASSSKTTGPLGGAVKSTPSSTVTSATRRPASLPVSPSKKHVCPDNSSPNHSAPAETRSAAPKVGPPLHAPPQATTIPAASTLDLAPPAHASSSSSTTPTPTTITTTAILSSPITASPSTSTPTASISTKSQPPSRRKPASLDSTPVILIADLSSPGPIPPQRRHTDTTQFLQTSRNSQRVSSVSTDGSSGGQRELLLPKTLQHHQQPSPPDEKRVSTYLKRRAPPVSFKAPLSICTTASAPSPGASTPSTVTTPVRVPPIRGFRSSGSRRSLVLEQGSKTMRHYDNSSDDSPGFDSREHTLRALEGRTDYGQITPPHSMEPDSADQEDTTDMFLNIAKEDSVRPSIEDGREDQSALVSPSESFSSFFSIVCTIFSPFPSALSPCGCLVWEGGRHIAFHAPTPKSAVEFFFFLTYCHSCDDYLVSLSVLITPFPLELFLGSKLLKW